MTIRYLNPIPAMSRQQLQLLAVIGINRDEQGNVSHYDDVSGIRYRDGDWYTQQNELWRPDCNLDQALALAQNMQVSCSLNYLLRSVTIMNDTFCIECLNLDDTPQHGATFANMQTTTNRNMARAIVYSLVMMLDYMCQ